MAGRPRKNTTSVQIRLSPELLTQIDSEYKERGHGDRSALISKAIELYLSSDEHSIILVVDGKQYDVNRKS